MGEEFLRTIANALPLRRLRTPSSYNHFYGVADAAARYCGIVSTPSHCQGHWIHSWFPIGYANDPRMLLDNMHDLNRAEPILVSRPDHSNLLRAAGYRNVITVGHPLVYQTPSAVRRVPGLLVAMPFHTTETDDIRSDFQRFADRVASYRDQFPYIIACVHPADWVKGFWPAAFLRAGIPVLKGAYARDFNSQPFLATLFSLADAVVTNGYGSHWAYASYFGARLSVQAMDVDLTREGLLQDSFWVRNQDLIDRVVQRLGRKTLEVCYPSFFVPPSEAKAHPEWGAKELGAEYRLPAKRLSHAMGWSGVRAIVRRSYASIRRVAERSPFDIAKAIARPDYRSLRRLANASEDDCPRVNVLGGLINGVDKQSLIANYTRYFVRRVLQFPSKLGQMVRVIDADPSEGLGLLAVNQQYPSARVTAFEPRAATRKVLIANARHSKLTDVVIEPAWLGVGEEPVDSAEFMTDADRHVWLDPPTVPQVPLRSLLTEPVDLLKLGHHRILEVLTAAADRLGLVRYLYCRVATDVSAPQQVDIVLGLLKDAGFRVFIENEVVPHTPLWFRPTCEGREMIVHLYCNR